ncbi:uncharacterized protein METZ01_LOCUS146853 [marine metagenome]|uniref:Uncharacterized protein n=1 Tax=marine metagenome TaxID=408172 RepID=A0A381ZXX4_9ZZZZ
MGIALIIIGIFWCVVVLRILTQTPQNGHVQSNGCILLMAVALAAVF